MDNLVLQRVYVKEDVDNLVLQRVAQLLKHIHGRGLRMFTHGNDSGGISMKFSAPNILGFRQSIGKQ